MSLEDAVFGGGPTRRIFIKRLDVTTPDDPAPVAPAPLPAAIFLQAAALAVGSLLLGRRKARPAACDAARRDRRRSRA